MISNEYGHSMASIGNGQAILGGQDRAGVFQDSIYYMTCSQKICMVMTLHQELSVPRADFVAFSISNDQFWCVPELGKL